MRRKTIAADAALLALVVLLTALAVFTATRLYRTAENRYVKEAFPLRFAVGDLLVQMLNEETGVRGFLITGARSSLEPYERGKPRVEGDLVTLRRLTVRRPEIAADVRSAEQLVRELEAFYGRQIALVEGGRAGRLKAQQNVSAGQALFDRFRLTNGGLITSANAIVASARSNQRDTYRTTLAIAIAAGTAAAAIAIWLLLSVPKRIWSLYDIERDLRDAAERGDRASRSLEHVDDAVILLDPEQTIRYWNPAATTFFGVAEASALGHDAGEVVPEFAQIEELLDTAPRSAVMPISRNGSERWLVARQTTFPDGRVVVLRDITSEHELERARTDFVATASHELRTPLAAVYGAVRTLRRHDRPADPQLDGRLLSMIEAESDRLKEIVEQILVSAEIDRGDIRLRAADCDLRALCENAVEAIRVRAPPKIGFSIDAPHEVTIESDPARLRQVVLNLLDNAVKFSPDGGLITVTVRAGSGVATIEIRDQGIGIPATAQGRVFEKFFRADPELRLGIGGSGLGLYISRELVERMDGRLRVQSSAGGGATFTIELPV